MSHYTPTTEAVRSFYIGIRQVPDLVAAAEFNRWLAAHDAELRAEIAAEILSHQGEIAAGTWYSAITYAARIAEGTS